MKEIPLSRGLAALVDDADFNRLSEHKWQEGGAMKVLFCGYGRAGKDRCAMTLARITGLRYAGSFSWAALPFMAQLMNLHPQECWETRHEHRAFWKSELDKLRESDQCYLARLALQSGDIAAGIRDRKEILAVRKANLFDHILWVERCGIGYDPTVTFGPGDADDVILNNGTLEELHAILETWAFRNRLI